MSGFIILVMGCFLISDDQFLCFSKIFSPIYTPEEWSANGDTYAGGKVLDALNSLLDFHIRTLSVCEATILACLSVYPSCLSL